MLAAPHQYSSKTMFVATIREFRLQFRTRRFDTFSDIQRYIAEVCLHQNPYLIALKPSIVLLKFIMIDLPTVNRVEQIIFDAVLLTQSVQILGTPALEHFAFIATIIREKTSQKPCSLSHVTNSCREGASTHCEHMKYFFSLIARGVV